MRRDGSQAWRPDHARGIFTRAQHEAPALPIRDGHDTVGASLTNRYTTRRNKRALAFVIPLSELHEGAAVIPSVRRNW